MKDDHGHTVIGTDGTHEVSCEAYCKGLEPEVASRTCSNYEEVQVQTHVGNALLLALGVTGDEPNNGPLVRLYCDGGRARELIDEFLTAARDPEFARQRLLGKWGTHEER